jgi:hypothetical protein
MYHHRFDAHFMTGPMNPQSHFPAVGNQNFFKHSDSSFDSWKDYPPRQTFGFVVTVACLKKKSRKNPKKMTKGQINPATTHN